MKKKSRIVAVPPVRSFARVPKHKTALGASVPEPVPTLPLNVAPKPTLAVNAADSTMPTGALKVARWLRAHAKRCTDGRAYKPTRAGLEQLVQASREAGYKPADVIERFEMPPDAALFTIWSEVTKP